MTLEDEILPTHTFLEYIKSYLDLTALNENYNIVYIVANQKCGFLYWFP